MPVTSAGASAGPDVPRRARGVLAGLVLAVSMTTIDQTIVALSGPSIQDHLGISHYDLQWAVNVYLLTTAAFFLLGGRLADVFGHKRIALVGVAGFGTSSLLCGLTPVGAGADAWLIAFRGLQGLSGALMFPAAIGIVVQTFPVRGRGRAMSTFFTVTGAMTAVGPIVGGYLTDWTWRSIFWINVPIAVAALVMITLMVPQEAPRRGEAIDIRGAALSAVAMALIVFGLQQAGTWGWSSAWVWVCLAGGALLLAAFRRLETAIRHPLINLRVFDDLRVRLATLSTFFASVAFIPVFFFLSVYGQVSLGLTASDTGLLMLKFFIGFAVAARFGGARFDRHGARPVILLGGVLGVIGFVWLARRTTDLDFDHNAFFNAQTWPLLVAGAGIGVMFGAAATDTVNRAIGASYGEVSALSQTMKNFGGALGLAVLSTLVVHRLTDRLTGSLRDLGGSGADARSAVNAITSDNTSQLRGVPSARRDAVLSVVRQDYAAAAQWAFYGMAVAMAALIVLALLYPKDDRAVDRDPERAAGTSR